MCVKPFSISFAIKQNMKSSIEIRPVNQRNADKNRILFQ